MLYLLPALLLDVARGPALPSTSSPPYVLEQRRLNAEQVRVRVFERKTNRIVWRYDAGSIGEAFRWSPDGKSVVLVDDRASLWKHSGYYRLVIWRAGQGVRIFDDLRPLKRFEALSDMRWSPDGQRLLLLGALSQGAADQGLLDLWCFHLRTQKSTMLTQQAVLSARWSDSNTVQTRLWSGRWNSLPDGSRQREERSLWLYCRQATAPPKRSNYPAGR